MLKKGLSWLAGLALVLAIVFATVWLVDFDATELGTAALRQASASTGIQPDASRYRINLVRGLELVIVEASARFPGCSFLI